MQQRLARQGLQRFVQDTVAPLTRRVGEAWEDGSFEVFEEHLFTELTKRLLRQAIAALPGGPRRPRVWHLRQVCPRPQCRKSSRLRSRHRRCHHSWRLFLAYRPRRAFA